MSDSVDIVLRVFLSYLRQLVVCCPLRTRLRDWRSTALLWGNLRMALETWRSEQDGNYKMHTHTTWTMHLRLQIITQ